MPPTLAKQILDETHTNNRELYDATLASLAKARKLRPIFLSRIPKEGRNTIILENLGRAYMEEHAALLIRGWLVKSQPALLCDFLDGLSIKHENGVVETLPDSVDDSSLNKTIDTILAKHSREVVVIYLNAFTSMNGTEWPNLAQMLSSDARLQLA